MTQFNVSRGGWNKAPYQSNGYRGNTQQWQKPKKRSGCKTGTNKSGDLYLTAWNVSKRHGFISIIAGAYSKTKEVKSKSGIVWQNWAVKVTPERQKPYFVSGMFNMQTRRLVIQELGMVANPNTRYFGTYKRR